ncbi:hypothetical protein VNO77_41554 [Canavalia gladiata]|uniref:Uncharacterized protein n=1 Tax=Canavalia gladiata TaxID=3824 RepID=A0AAN9K104_CANGL
MSWLLQHFASIEHHMGNEEQLNRFTRAYMLRLIGGVLFCDHSSSRLWAWERFPKLSPGRFPYEDHTLPLGARSFSCGGGDFVAGFLLGGAIFGTLAYLFAPQIRRCLLNEDEYGFCKAKRPIYYDDGLESTRQTLNKKISQLNSVIDKVYSRLRGGNNVPPAQIENDPEVEATM